MADVAAGKDDLGTGHGELQCDLVAQPGVRAGHHDHWIALIRDVGCGPVSAQESSLVRKYGNARSSTTAPMPAVRRRRRGQVSARRARDSSKPWLAPDGSRW